MFDVLLITLVYLCEDENISITSFLLFAVLDDAGGVDEGDPLQQLVGHLHAHQPLQEALAKLLQGGEGAGAVGCHNDALYGPKLVTMHYNCVLRGGGLSTWRENEEEVFNMIYV